MEEPVNLIRVTAALEELEAILRSDGYELTVTSDKGGLNAQVSATSEACPECLIPKGLFGEIVLERLQMVGISVSPDDLVISYPID
jgi:hypothetical protein